ncbi:DinB family protein [Spirosoma taeanense]|uniref:DinB family protein n=1 Tax=Spirosoma taeanense TaxID=2735870 RepID=A0A6M5Y2K3_9BACT|nr:DinB family protein [Spirosoma taeanense]QJW88019.1 DinB family protein [Spirosoma taeanense]
MKKSEIPVMPEFFDRYINLAEDLNVVDALNQTASFDQLMPAETLEALGDLRYAPGKWTVRDILQHIIDNERIMTYRALRFARNDQTTLPGYDEELLGANAQATRRTLADLYAEYALVRQSSIALFKSFDREMLLRSGTCYNRTISVLALGFVLVGHPIHHVNIIRERYLPLLS